MRELIGSFPKPSHYAGAETGAVRAKPEKVNLRVALAFPDAYEVGMSYLGHKILYGIINSRPGWHAERVLAPAREAGDILLANDAPLCTLETDTPLAKTAAIGFAITHELCYPDVLRVLELGKIPLRHKDRPESLFECPLIIAGGGGMLGAEPLAPFIDIAALGDGEELLPELLQLLEKARVENWPRSRYLLEASQIHGAYVPSLFVEDGEGDLKPLVPDQRPKRRIVKDLNLAPYPEKQVVPINAVHNRLTLEIARGCSRGCRFCHAGMTYRPVRERDPQNLLDSFNSCLNETGFEEVSFLSLSAGDYTALKELFRLTRERCAGEQVALALPSLRVGSADDEIMKAMAELRRTGHTIAPEAGGQRLRDVINKGVNEEELLKHARKLLKLGWRAIKLYFMIGLPTETDEDIEAIAKLCEKVRDSGGPGAPKLAVTASLSPFVPKPFTPFQWEAQIGRDEIYRRVNLARSLFKPLKNVTLRWHNPDMSFLEGILARGDRKLADAVELAYRKGAFFCGWVEAFSLEPWLKAFAELGIDPENYRRERQEDERLPWEHLEAGVTREFLIKERRRAYEGKITPDCRFAACQNCGACAVGSRDSLLAAKPGEQIAIRQVYDKLDRDSPAGEEKEETLIDAGKPARPRLAPKLAVKAAYYKIWHAKTGAAAYLSQLEVQAIITRALRRARLPLAFSQGYHPLPLLSFGRALPVGMESLAEWFAIALRSPLATGELRERLSRVLNEDMRPLTAEITDKSGATEGAIMETFRLTFRDENEAAEAADIFAKFAALNSKIIERQTKKGTRQYDARSFLKDWRPAAAAISFTLDWRPGYLSPLAFVQAALDSPGNHATAKLTKTAQIFANGRVFNDTA